MSKADERNLDFQHLVLMGLWVLILCAFGKKPHKQAIDFRSGAVRFGDAHGNQGEGAEKYRREHTYWAEHL